MNASALQHLLIRASRMPEQVAVRAAKAAAAHADMVLAAAILGRDELPAAEAVAAWELLRKPTTDVNTALLTHPHLPVEAAGRVLDRDQRAGTRRRAAAHHATAATTLTLLMDRHPDDPVMLLTIAENTTDRWQLQARAVLLLSAAHAVAGSRLRTEPLLSQLRDVLYRLHGPAASAVAEQSDNLTVLRFLPGRSLSAAAHDRLIQLLITDTLAPVKDKSVTGYSADVARTSALDVTIRLSSHITDIQRGQLRTLWAGVPARPADRERLRETLDPHPDPTMIAATSWPRLRTRMTDPRWAASVAAHLDAALGNDEHTWQILEKISEDFTGTLTELLEAVHAIQAP